MAYGDEKTYGSAKYHGMKVGGVHHWTYPDGQWTERKVRPDRWEVTYTSLKRRNKKAPRNSGAEIGSGYHWFITAHQWVEKLDANTYATHLEGSKYLVSFRKPDWPVWNTQFRNSKRHAKEKTIEALKDAIRRIEDGSLDLEDPVQKDALTSLIARSAEDAYHRESEDKTVVRPTAAKEMADLGTEEKGKAETTDRSGRPGRTKRPSRKTRTHSERRRQATAR